MTKRDFFRFCVTLPEKGDVDGLRAFLAARPKHARALLREVREGPDHGRFSLMAYSTWLCRFDAHASARAVVEWLISGHRFLPDLWTALALDDLALAERLLSADPGLARSRHPLFGHPAIEIARPSQRGPLLGPGADDGSIWTAVVLDDITRAVRMLEAEPSSARARRPDVDHATLLAHALTWGRDALARLMPELGADPDAPDDNGYTPRGDGRTHGTPCALAWLQQRSAGKRSRS